MDIISLAILALLLLVLAAALYLLLPGRDRRTTYVRLLWWRVRGAKTAPEIPAGAIAVEHPDAAVARSALNERIAAARARAEALAAKEAEAQGEPVVLSEGDEIVLLDEDEAPPALADVQAYVDETGEADVPAGWEDTVKPIEEPWHRYGDDQPGSGSRRI